MEKGAVDGCFYLPARPSSIERIPDDRMPYRGKVYPDLMRTTCLRKYLKKGETGEAPRDFKPCQRLSRVMRNFQRFCVSLRLPLIMRKRCHCTTPSRARATRERERYLAVVIHKGARDQRVIFLFDFAFAKCAGKIIKRLRCAGNDHHAGYQLVQTVHNPRTRRISS